MKRNKELRLIVGGSATRFSVNGVTVSVVADSAAALPVDVRVFEEDTYLVLTVDPVMRYVDEHPVRLMTRIMESRPHIPGTVVRKKTNWYAVVHDLDVEPICRKEWLDSAYAETLRLAEGRGIVRLGLPLLGTVHGRYPLQDSLMLLMRHIRKQNLTKVREIVIIAKRGSRETIRKLLVQSSRP